MEMCNRSIKVDNMINYSAKVCKLVIKSRDTTSMKKVSWILPRSIHYRCREVQSLLIISESR